MKTASSVAITPYQYAGNKPINFVDLDGLEEFDLSKIRTDYPTVQAPSLEAFILGKREGTYAVSQTKTPSFGIHPQLGRVEWWFHSDFTDGSRPKGAWMWRTVDPPTRMEPRPITLLPPPLPPSELKLPPPLPPPPIRIAPRPTVTGRVQQDPIAAPVPAAGEPMAPSDGDGQALPARQPMTSPPPPNVGWFFGGPGIAAFRKQPGFDRDMANLAQWLIDNPDYNITIEAGGGSFPWNDWDSTIGLSSTTYGERVDNMNAIRRAALQNVLDQNGINVDNRVTFKRGEVNKAPVTISVDP